MSENKSHSKRKSKEAKRPVTLVAGVFFIVGLAVLGGFYFEQNTQITHVDFSGNQFTSTEDLETTIAEITPVGMMADSIDFGMLMNSVNTLPYVKDVNITMGFRGKLQFNITEREPLALLIDGNRRSYVSEGGVKLPIIPEKTEDVPLVYGFTVEPLSDTLKTDAFRQVEEFLTAARENRFGWITISEVAWNEREGVVALTAENGVKLLFGHSDFDTRLKHWQAFYGEVISTKGIEAFTQIDLRFRNQVVTKE